MKRFRIALLAAGFLAAFLAAPNYTRAQSVQDFTINSFTADYYLSRDQNQTSILHTVENIQAQFPTYDQNHGILRALPESYLGHTISLHVAGVTDENNQPLHYTTSEQNGNLVLKIGDAGTYVHGLKTYIITYDAKNVISFFQDHQEFYWDVNGDQWLQPFGVVTARLHTAPALDNFIQDRTACYAGTNGYSNSGNCTITKPEPAAGGGKLITAEVKNLYAGQTLTFVAGFNAGTFKLGPEIAQAQRAERLKIIGIICGMAALPLASFIYLYSRWRKYGRDPKGRGIIIPEYQPPKGLNVLSSDYIFREALNNKAISALVLELAIRKYLTIYERVEKKRLQKDVTVYSLKLIKDPAGLNEEERAVVDMFFDKPVVGSEVDLSALKNKLASKTSTLKKKLGKDMVTAGYLSNDPNSAGNSYYLVGALLALGGFFFLSFIFPPIGISIGLAGLIFLLFARYMPARSQKGMETHDYMLGLRDYIKLAEADRLKFLQSPQGAEKIQESGVNPSDPKYKVKLFESLLPYAMVFNLEKDWAKQFENVYTEPPGWYNGNWNTFNAVYLANSIGGFNSASAVTFTSPSSSGSSGFGGGFSGGGGGGGGGGGW